jgi:low temperature requirement protein LtrA
MPRGAVGRLPLPTMAAAPLLVIADALGGTARALCWIGALAVWFTQSRADTQRPAHLSDHRLAIILALGESVVALGIGAGGRPLTGGLIAGALLGMAVVGALWWAYFDVDAIAADPPLRDAEPTEQFVAQRPHHTQAFARPGP